MRQIGYRYASELLAAVAEETLECQVALERVSGAIGHDHAQRRVIEDRPNALLTRPQRRKRLLPCRDVPGDHLYGRPAIECHRPRDDLDVERGPVELEVPFLRERDGLAPAEHRLHPGSHERPVLGRHPVDHRRPGQVTAVEFSRGPVVEHHRATLVNYDRIRQDLEQPLEPRLGLGNLARDTLAACGFVAGCEYAIHPVPHVDAPSRPQDTSLAAVLPQPLRGELDLVLAPRYQPVKSLLGLVTEVRAEPHQCPQ